MGLPPAAPVITTLSLTDAITAFDSAQATLANADSAQTVAKGQVDAAKLQAAQDAKTATDTADTQAVAAFNQSIDDLIAAATAAKR